MLRWNSLKIKVTWMAGLLYGGEWPGLTGDFASLLLNN